VAPLFSCSRPLFTITSTFPLPPPQAQIRSPAHIHATTAIASSPMMLQQTNRLLPFPRFFSPTEENLQSNVSFLLFSYIAVTLLRVRLLIILLVSPLHLRHLA
jgi:hypothetical protein